jgi:hypothetical protein
LPPGVQPGRRGKDQVPIKAGMGVGIIIREAVKILRNDVQDYLCFKMKM